MRAIKLCIILLFVFSHVQATTFYSRTSGGNWTTPGTWSTASYGGASAATFPSTNDTVKIGDTYTITINAVSACAMLEVGQGTSGILQYSSASGYSLTVGGNVVVKSGGIFRYNSNSTRTHTLSIGGDLTNNGTIGFYFDSNDLVNISFTGAAASIVSGTGTWTLNTVTLSKTASTNTVEVQASAFESAIVTLTTSTGTYIHNNSGSYSINSSVSTDFSITQNVVFQIPQGTLTFSPNSTRLYLYGSLYVNGGTVVIGNNTGTNGIRYDKVGTNVPYLEVSSGSMTVYGGITYASGASSDPFSFNMSGGTMLMNCGSTGTSNEVFNVNDVATSMFNMSDGVITIQKHNSGSGNNTADWSVCGSAGTVTTTGGTVEFGNSSSTATSFDFVPFANVVQPNFKVTGPSGTAITLQPSKSTTANFKLLSLYIDANKTFDITSIAGSAGNSKSMTITSTYDGSSSFTNSGTFTARSGRVVLGGTSAQSIGGSTTTSFYDLSISNSAGVTLYTPANVTDSLLMNSGILVTTNTNILTCTSTGNANIGSSTSYVNGPMIHTMALSGSRTLTFPVGKDTDYRPAVLTPTHSSATSATYRCEVINSPASALAYALPSTLSRVSSMRYWLINRAAVANYTSATLKLYYGTNDFVTDSSSLRVAEGVGANWADHGGTGTANGIGNITSAVFLTFNTVFTLGNSTGGSNTLPVKWLEVDAHRVDKNIVIDWKTAVEINNAYFTVERSGDGIHFDPLGDIPGAGNSTNILSYSFVDEHPSQGNNYYRISQTDYDGSIDYSTIVKVESKPGVKNITATQRGLSDEVVITFEGMKNEIILVTCYNMMGEVLKKAEYQPGSDYEQAIVVLPTKVIGSVCLLNVVVTNESWSKKIIAGSAQ